MHDTTDSSRDDFFVSEKSAMPLKPDSRLEGSRLLDNAHQTSELTDIREDSWCVILYNDDEQETRNIDKEKWIYEK